MHPYKRCGTGSAGNRRRFDLKPILLVRGFIENTCSGDGAFDQFFSAKRLRGSSYIETSFLNPLRHSEMTISQQHVPFKDIAIFPNLPAQYPGVMQGSQQGKRAKLWGPRAHFRANISMKIEIRGKRGATNQADQGTPSQTEYRV